MQTKTKLTEIPRNLRHLAGKRQERTRIYRRQGSYEQMVEWFDNLCSPLHVTVSPGGAAVYAGVTREGVYKRMRAGRLTAFCFHITKKKKTIFGGEKVLKAEPVVYLSIPECQAWRAELEARAARIEASRQATDEDLAAFEETEGDHTATMHDFLNNDPADKKRKKVRRRYPWEQKFMDEGRFNA